MAGRLFEAVPILRCGRAVRAVSGKRLQNGFWPANDLEVITGRNRELLGCRSFEFECGCLLSSLAAAS
jgi:hypothetical protein